MKRSTPILRSNGRVEIGTFLTAKQQTHSKNKIYTKSEQTKNTHFTENIQKKHINFTFQRVLETVQSGFVLACKKRQIDLHDVMGEEKLDC